MRVVSNDGATKMASTLQKTSAPTSAGVTSARADSPTTFTQMLHKQQVKEGQRVHIVEPSADNEDRRIAQDKSGFSLKAAQ